MKDVQQDQPWQAPRSVGEARERLPAWCLMDPDAEVRPVEFGRHDGRDREPEDVNPRADRGPAAAGDKDAQQPLGLPDDQPDGGSGPELVLDEAALAKAREEGFAEGLEVGIEEGRAAERLDSGISGVSDISSLLTVLKSEAAELVSDLAVEVARSIVREEIARDDVFIMDSIQVCLDKRVPNGQVKLRLHPEVVRRIERLNPRPDWLDGGNSEPAVRLVGDQSMALGDCVLESDKMRIDARLDSQIEQVRDVLRSTLFAELFPEDP